LDFDPYSPLYEISFEYDVAGQLEFARSVNLGIYGEEVFYGYAHDDLGQETRMTVAFAGLMPNSAVTASARMRTSPTRTTTAASL